ncbi:MAG: redox-regulated ATPase YchF [Deltaproteobacteria bacterium]|jgi:GTP-binding protein YchF|nr:redox-regulated ATPase YchF [Deltaproteobacteria bacterium]
MKLGIIGLPGAGKSTLFEALTKIIQEDTTHKPEDRLGTIKVPDDRVNRLSSMYNPKKTIYAQIEYLLPYIAAQKPGHKSDEAAWTTVRTCDALIQVLRNFEGYGGETPTPLEDFNRLNEEMIFADLLVVEKRLERLALDSKRGKKADPEEVRLLTECKEMLEKEKPLRHNPELAAAKQLKGFTFLSGKPMLILFNNPEDSENIPDTGETLAGEKFLAIRGDLEHELAQMDENEAEEYLLEYGISTSAMDRMISLSYELLGLISFFTVGPDEVRAWTIKKDTVAVDAAEVIHSDIKKGFIRAEVVAYDDLMEAGSYKEARNRGTVRLEGKTYPVQDGDIIEFRFNV